MIDVPMGTNCAVCIVMRDTLYFPFLTIVRMMLYIATLLSTSRFLDAGILILLIRNKW